MPTTTHTPGSAALLAKSGARVQSVIERQKKNGPAAGAERREGESEQGV